MRYLIITFLILSFTNSCSNKSSKEISKPITLKFAIIKLPLDELQHVAQDFSSTWVPDTMDLIIAEQVIKEAVRNIEGVLLSKESLPYYFRQYVGFRNSAGERIIFVNALCEINDIPVEENGEFILEPWPWREELIFVNDGGDCYWNILINIDKQEHSNFFINGVG